jgi:hypothetical protein
VRRYTRPIPRYPVAENSADPAAGRCDNDAVGDNRESAEDGREWSVDETWQLLLDLREGAEVGTMVAAMRPQRDALGKLLGLWLDLLENNLHQNTLAAARPFMEAQEQRRASEVQDDSDDPDDDVDGRAWRVAADTPAARDLSVWQEQGWPPGILQPYREQDEGPVLRFGHRIMDAAIDNLRGVAVLISDQRVVRPPLALSRVALDATAHLTHVLEPGIAPEERIVRVLNESLLRLDEDLRAAQREDDQEGIDQATRELAAIFDAVGSRRATQRKRHRGFPPFIGDKPTYTSQMIHNMLGDGSLWNLLSGFVHSTDTVAHSLVTRVSPHQGQYVVLYATGAVLGLVMLTDVIEPYSGWDLSPTRDCNPTVYEQWGAGAGMLDDHYRDRARQQRRDDGSTERLAREYAEARLRSKAATAEEATDE